MIRLLVADDHRIMREGLKQLFALVKDFEVVAEAENGAQVLELLRQTTVDLLLLDMTMPGSSGEDLIGRVHAHYPKLPMLILSMHNEAHIAQRALRAGASGYMTKDRDPETLLAAIRKVSAGGRYLDPVLAEQIALQNSGLAPDSPSQTLSAREFQILRMLAQGLSVNQIAEQLVISNKTVSTHKTHLMEKMSFSSSTDLVRYALSQGLV
ncbi:DNA-binding response regulator [Pseudomonas sp. TKO26]|uniref:response regulator n=1 Tax=unclassified Pseudomonas TaxID=196821 RepID=UPI000D975024|nr:MULTISPECIES: response regulator transcription factor [unclassified Pseudomonas]PYY84852.1 DNA-binding response regulator [Pseudomonas sp. TKO30]PYY86760.1 DNA-binding response regulator [Pseudomonas sp. TKO29]PYY89403.1 DNA-binding response regulator [Pseudomonas sp. TKO26]PYY99232.1 DNA-binding response regulator [Pseudomonas sp. TKO14]